MGPALRKVAVIVLAATAVVVTGLRDRGTAADQAVPANHLIQERR
ncbi:MULTISPECIES: hypothetical protein [Streptomyces]|nr:hypothetical protein [Streptomyces coriariae]